MSTTYEVTGSYAGQKAPNLNGIAVLLNGSLTAYNGPSGALLPASVQPSCPGIGGICGDITNGVAFFSGNVVSYLPGVAAATASWYSLPPLKTSIIAMCGDMINGLAVTDGTNVWVMLFNGPSGSGAWTPLASPPLAAPWSVIDIAGDPTNGILLVMGQDNYPSSLYWGLGTSVEACNCAWIPLTSPSTNLPSAKISVSQACGSSANGFVLYGDSQFFSLTAIKSTPATPTAAGSCVVAQAKLPSPPFNVSSISGDATNGITALDNTSGLIATTSATLASWTVVSVEALTNG